MHNCILTLNTLLSTDKCSVDQISEYRGEAVGNRDRDGKDSDPGKGGLLLNLFLKGKKS